MSLPIYKDFDKCARGTFITFFFALSGHVSYMKLYFPFVDIFSDDFDTSSSLKVKSAAPYGVVSFRFVCFPSVCIFSNISTELFYMN